MKTGQGFPNRSQAPPDSRHPGHSPYNADRQVGGRARRPWMRELKARPVEDQTITSAALSGSQIDELLERPERILVLESPDIEATLGQFEAFARQTGKAVYLWRPEQGLNSLKVADMRVPGSDRLAEALRYVVNSLHYGIYGFVEFEATLKMDGIQLLRQIASAQSGYDRKVILLTNSYKLPRGLEQLAAVIRHTPQQKLRLRDGRWVL